MTLSAEHIELLKKPFAIEDHEHRKGGADGLLTYLTEEPLIDRLNEVDPNWGFRIVNTHISDYRGEQPDTVTVHGELTLCGITRANFGVSVADIKRSEWIDGTRVTLDTPEISPLGEKDIKGAATDALKRCARMFGVGGYLLRLKDVKIKNEADFARWYRQQFAAPHPATGEVKRDPTPPPAANGKPPAPAPEGDWWEQSQNRQDFYKRINARADTKAKKQAIAKVFDLGEYDTHQIVERAREMKLADAGAVMAWLDEQAKAAQSAPAGEA